MCCLNIRRFFGLFLQKVSFGFFLQKVFFGLLLNEAEIILAYSAKRANPIIWDVFECCTWSDAALWITYFWIINPTTHVANIFLHNVPFFLNLIDYCYLFTFNQSGAFAYLSDLQCKYTLYFCKNQINLKIL